MKSGCPGYVRFEDAALGRFHFCQFRFDACTLLTDQDCAEESCHRKRQQSGDREYQDLVVMPFAIAGFVALLPSTSTVAAVGAPPVLPTQEWQEKCCGGVIVKACRQTALLFRKLHG